jgi:AraC family transcriptional regulator of adaptative response / DNA-3-methyladenine glycosylase II
VAVRAILGQRISVAAARTLAGRLAAAFGEPCEAPFDSVRTVFPSAQAISNLPHEEISRLGISASSAKAIVAMARAVADGSLVLAPNADVEATLTRLRALPGIGEWTAQYVAMRALGWPDAFPHTDLGVMKALGESRPARVLEAAERWRPWRAYAVMHLWKSLEKRKTP